MFLAGVNVSGRYRKWPVFSRPLMAGFGRPPRAAASRGDLGHVGRVAPESALSPCVMERIRDLPNRYDITREAVREDGETLMLVA